MAEIMLTAGQVPMGLNADPLALLDSWLLPCDPRFTDKETFLVQGPHPSNHLTHIYGASPKCQVVC